MRTGLPVVAGVLAIALAPVLAAPALAQNVGSTVSSATRTVTGAVGGAGGGSQNPYAVLNDTAGPGSAAGIGGNAPGGMKLKYGGKEIQIRGAVGVESGQSAVRGGASIGF